MKINEIDAIKCMIDIAIQSNNIDDVKNIKNYIEDKIVEYENNLLFANKDVIYERLSDFIHNYIPGIERRNLKFKLMLGAIRDIKGIEIEDIYVGDVIGIDSNDLSSSKYYCGELTILKLEQTLNKFGYSITDELTNEQENRLEQIRVKNNEEDAKLFGLKINF